MTALPLNLTTLVPALITPLTSYLLNRMFPAPHAGFIVVSSTVYTYAQFAISNLGQKIGKELTEEFITRKKNPYNPIFHHLSHSFSYPITLLLPIIARTIGQRMGYAVPSYLLTVGYFSLTTSSFWISKELLEYCVSAWDYFNPATK
ncbi:MAG TPA: hypothetical protein VFU89_07990 [Rhabdochlamydiaceae bacterium]|nr:hypothetical protein [Rhabdochlamydiaceae bacterium]